MLQKELFDFRLQISFSFFIKSKVVISSSYLSIIAYLMGNSSYLDRLFFLHFFDLKIKIFYIYMNFIQIYYWPNLCI